jgi:hypothetical protein
VQLINPARVGDADREDVEPGEGVQSVAVQRGIVDVDDVGHRRGSHQMQAQREFCRA